MRRFVFVAHNAPSDGAWRLDDLPGSGRADVLCRNVQAALCLSHGVRPDVETYIALVQPTPRVLRLEGRRIQRLYPDERSTAARMSKALGQPGAGPSWKELEPGVCVADLDLEDLLDDVAGTLVLLDPKGTPVADANLPVDPTFLLSDHVPFTDVEYRLVEQRAAAQISLGPAWYHGNLAVAVVHHALDTRFGAPAAR